MKPYVKLASGLVMAGMGLFMLERYGLSQMGGQSGLHLAGWLLSVLVVVPVALVLSGCAVFMVGKMRRL